MIISELYRGKIYAGETPLVCSITVEQSGPLELSIKAGSFTTTGEAVVLNASIFDPKILPGMIDNGEAEMVGEDKVRVWLKTLAGGFVGKSVQYTLAADQVLQIVPDPIWTKFVKIDLGLYQGAVDLLVYQRLNNALDYPPDPAGWQPLAELVREFAVPPGATELPDIYVLSVEPGFPPGTTPSDWQV